MLGDLSVSDFNRLASACIDASPLQNCRVEGEISAAKRYPSGHFYFTLKDDKASVSCVMWRGDVQTQRQLPQEGAHVLCHGRAGIYERDGRFQLYVKRFQPLGEGDLWQRFEALKKELGGLGWFDQKLKKRLPQLPRTIGVVTSSSGAVIHDIVNVLRRRFPGFCLRLINTKVQGAGAAEEIARGIKLFNILKAADVLIVGRGGGSLEDLWCFNERIVAEAVHESKIPIISAVGHESDFSICDFCADLRAPTPSAAAELILPEKRALIESLRDDEQKLNKSIRQCLMLARQSLSSLSRALVFALEKRFREESLALDALSRRSVLTQPLAFLSPRRAEITQLRQRLEQSVASLLLQEKQHLSFREQSLEHLSPWKLLARGYAAVETEEGRLLSSVHDMTIPMKLCLRMQDGRVLVQTEEIIKGET